MTWPKNRSEFGVNRTPVLIGLDYVDETSTIPVAVDPTNGNLLVEVTAGGTSGTQYQELTTTSPATGTLALGRYLSTLPTLTNAQMFEPMLDSSSRLLVAQPTASALNATVVGSTVGSATPLTAFPMGISDGTDLRVLVEPTADGVAATGMVSSGLMLYDGSTWERARGDLGDGSAATGLLVNNSLVYNGSTYDRTRSAVEASGSNGIGVLASSSLGIAATALPTAITATDYAVPMTDVFGRQVVIPQAPRNLVGQVSTTITSSTASTDVLAGASSIYSDISSIVLVNSDISATLFTLSDGTNSYYFYVPAGDMRGASYNVPLPATTADTNWTGTCGTSVNALYVTIVYIKNR